MRENQRKEFLFSSSHVQEMNFVTIYLSDEIRIGAEVDACGQIVRVELDLVIDGVNVSALMAYRGMTLPQAADDMIFHRLAKDDGGLIASEAHGNYAMPFNSSGMFHGVATILQLPSPIFFRRAVNRTSGRRPSQTGSILR